MSEDSDWEAVAVQLTQDASEWRKRTEVAEKRISELTESAANHEMAWHSAEKRLAEVLAVGEEEVAYSLRRVDEINTACMIGTYEKEASVLARAYRAERERRREAEEKKDGLQKLWEEYVGRVQGLEFNLDDAKSTLAAMTKERDNWQSDAKTFKACWDQACDDLASAQAQLARAEKVIEAARREHDRIPSPGMTIASCVRPVAGCSMCSHLAAYDAASPAKAPCLDPDKMKGAEDGFGGSDFDRSPAKEGV